MTDDGNVRKLSSRRALAAAADLGLIGAELVGETDAGVPIYEGPPREEAEAEPPPAPVGGLQGQWERCAPWLIEGMAGSLLSIDDVKDRVARGVAVLWPGDKSAVVTQIGDHTGGARVLEVLAAGGELGEIVSMTPGVIAHARALGCSDFIVEGRRGWERALKAFGFEFMSVTVRKVL